jgi:endonuclease/exonuclease/phosphatase family metal-dependent hydrolase
MPLKVLTLNLWNTMGPYERRRARVREWVERLDPDLIGFQEALKSATFDQIGEILDGLPYEIEHAAATEHQGMLFGNAVASRWPISDRAVVELPTGDRDEGRCALNITAAAPFGAVSFTTTHLNWKLHDGHSREQQVVALADFVIDRRPRGGYPPIVVGDFNAEPRSMEIRYMSGYASLHEKSVMFYDAWRVAGDGGKGMTWSNVNAYASIALEPERRIDYVFAGYPIRMTEDHGVGKIETCRVVCNDEVDGIWPSDHFGVYAELRTEPLDRPAWAMG